jgi:hypothetical protein
MVTPPEHVPILAGNGVGVGEGPLGTLAVGLGVGMEKVPQVFLITNPFSMYGTHTPIRHSMSEVQLAPAGSVPLGADTEAAEDTGVEVAMGVGVTVGVGTLPAAVVGVGAVPEPAG